MVFPSLPIYLDPPNWLQQEPNNYHQQGGIGGPIPVSHHQPPSPTVSASVGDGGYQSSIRPGSMADRARLAKIHQPEAAMKCPRCESTNTKFCYYNNYSLSQPRHFCKTCRRYWTRGGALRNVPVGGGCRRNKRSKGSNRSNSNSKSPMKGTGSSSASANSSSSVCTTDVNVMTHHLPFLASNLQHHYNNNNYILGGRNGNTSSEFQIGNNDGVFEFPNGVSEQWRLPQLQVLHQQHFPNFLNNLEQPQFQFGRGENNNNNGEPSSRIRANGVSGILMPQLKMEENEGMSLAAAKNNNMLSSSGNGTNLFWNGNGNGNVWSEAVPSNFTSPSPGHLL